MFRDADGDGRHGQTLQICHDAAIPPGFSASTQGEDSRDDDPRSWSGIARTCTDADGDGHFVDCDGYPEGEDCDDTLGFIHPGAIESVGSNFDCDATTNINVDESQGIFASGSGSDAAPCGTRAAPCRSLARADELLSAEPAGSQRRYIFANSGPFRENGLILRHSIIGGFSVGGVSSTTWTRSFSARQEDLNGLSAIDGSAADGPRFTTQGDGLVFDGLYVTGDRLTETGDCTGWSMQGPVTGDGAAEPAETRGNLIIHSFVYQRCGDLASNVTGLSGGHPLVMARSTVHIEADTPSPPLNVRALDLYPRRDTWLEDAGIIVGQLGFNRHGVRFVPQVADTVLQLRNVRVELQGAAQFNQNNYGVQVFDGQVMAEELVALDQESSVGPGYALLVSRTGSAAVRADVVRSHLRMYQTPFAIDGGEARIVQSYLDSSAGENGAVHVASNSRLLLLNSVVRSDSTTPVAVLAAPGAAEIVAINSIFDVARGDRPVTGIRTTNTPVRLLNNAFSLSANTAPGECPVDVAGQSCAGLFVNDCSSWGNLCTESAGNLVADIAFSTGGSPGTPFEGLHLPSGSPCIDAALNLGATPLLPPGNRWLRTDVDGDVRPDTGWDIGLDERP